MALYFKDIEITNIDNLVPQTGLGVTDMWFGSTNVYTVWETYEGALPTTLNANGDNLRQYQVWGNTGGVGDRTINCFDYTQLVNGYTYNSDGQMILNPDVNRWNYAAIPFIRVTPGATYLRTSNLAPSGNIVNYYDNEKSFIAQVTPGTGAPFTVPNNCYFIAFVINVFTNDRKKYMLTEGPTAPMAFVPFGYEADISISDGTNATTTPIYIGSDPLGKDEYVDYQAGKVFKRTENLLNYLEIDYEHSWDNSGQKAPPTGTNNFASPMIAVVPGRTYLRTYDLSPTGNVFFTYDAQKNFLSRESAGNNLPFTVGQNVAYITYNIPVRNDRLPELYMLTEGSTAPSTCIPYLQPTDPPVPFPALPTCEGTTIVDYAGSGTAPDKVLLNYRKEEY